MIEKTEPTPEKKEEPSDLGTPSQPADFNSPDKLLDEVKRGADKPFFSVPTANTPLSVAELIAKLDKENQPAENPTQPEAYPSAYLPVTDTRGNSFSSRRDIRTDNYPSAKPEDTETPVRVVPIRVMPAKKNKDTRPSTTADTKPSQSAGKKANRSGQAKSNNTTPKVSDYPSAQKRFTDSEGNSYNSKTELRAAQNKARGKRPLAKPASNNTPTSNYPNVHNRFTDSNGNSYNSKADLKTAQNKQKQPSAKPANSRKPKGTDSKDNKPYSTSKPKVNPNSWESWDTFDDWSFSDPWSAFKRGSFTHTFRHKEPEKPVDSALDILKAVNSSSEARSSLTRLFDTMGEKLFKTNGSYPVDKEATLRFIDAYSKAIKNEGKPNKGNTYERKARQSKKQNERLQALALIRNYVSKLDNNDDEHCRLAIQLCGRVRERNLVHQKSFSLCGAFAVLQSAWGQNPMLVTRMALDLAKSGETEIDTMVKGSKKRLRIRDFNPDYDYRKYDASWADSLLLAVRHQFGYAGSITTYDALGATYFGMPAKVADQQQVRNISSLEARKRLLPALLEASGKRCIVEGSISSPMSSLLQEMAPMRDYHRKSSEQPENIEPRMRNLGYSRDGVHAVIIENLKKKNIGGQEVIQCKLHTWGKVLHIQMSVDSFLNNIDIGFCNIIGENAKDHYSGFKELDKNKAYPYAKNDKQYYAYLDGHETDETPPPTYYTYRV